MKNLDYYMSLPYKIVLVPDIEEGGFAALHPELTGCITVGETIEDAIENLTDAKKTWLQAELEDGHDIPEPDNLEKYSGQFKLRLPKSLHKQLAEQSRREGISMNQYCLYLLAQNNALESK